MALHPDPIAFVDFFSVKSRYLPVFTDANHDNPLNPPIAVQHDRMNRQYFHRLEGRISWVGVHLNINKDPTLSARSGKCSRASSD